MAKNGERAVKHTGAISVALGNMDNILLSSPVSSIEKGRRTRDVGVGRNGPISPVDVHGGGRQALLSSAEAGLLAPAGGMGSSSPSYRRGDGNSGSGNSPGGDTGGGFPRGAKHELVGDSGEKRLMTGVGVSMGMSPANVNGGGAGNGGYAKGEILVYGQHHVEEEDDHHHRQRQSGISQHFQGAGVSQEEGVYSPGKGDRFSSLSPGIFPPGSSEAGAGGGGGGVGGERRRSHLDDEFGMPHRREGDGSMVGQMPEESGSRAPSYVSLYLYACMFCGFNCR